LAFGLGYLLDKLDAKINSVIRRIY
jgi:hypothetical protein